MEEVPGISRVLPPLVPYCTASKLPPKEWQACLDSWLVSIEARLRLPDEEFSKLPLSHNGSGVPFLLSYFRRPTHAPGKEQLQPAERRLHRCSYLLTKRLLLSIQESNFLTPADMLQFVLQANADFYTVSEWQQTLKRSVFYQSASFDSSIASWKTLTANSLLSEPPSKWREQIKAMNLLVKTLPRVGFELMKGADYLEALMHAYTGSDSSAQSVIIENAYRSLLSLLSPEYTRPNSLMDQLHLLKSESSHQPEKKTLCSALVCETSFLRHLSAGTGAMKDTKRGRDFIDNLIVYRDQTRHLHPQPPRRKPKVSKGKGKDEGGHDEMHFHRAASISQVHELFPHLSTAYILGLLDHFQDSTEAVIAALLEPDSLPPHLQVQAQNEEDGKADAATSAPSDRLVPHATPPLPPQRRNVFDGDDFDNLRISPRQVHRGRRAIDVSSAEPASAEEHNRSKAAILAALAAFDSDDDERDDTYDVADVGGSVDQSVDTDSRQQQRPPAEDGHEESLFRAWKDSPALFARDSQTRIGAPRQQLKRDLGMTDEQIEGWAVMLARDPARQRRLDKKYSAAAAAAFHGTQAVVLGQTKWSASAEVSAENSTGDEDDHDEQGGNGNGNSRGRGGRGRRGAGTQRPPAAAQSQAGKNRAEHARQHGGFRGGGRGRPSSRREGRAKKMARAGGGPSLA